MNLTLLQAGAAQGEAGGFPILPTILIYGGIFLLMYLLLFRPQNKKKKKEAAMRKNVQIGDEVTTIGGVCGRVIAVKEESDTIIIETGSDKSKLRLKKWAIGSVDTIHEDEEA